MYDQLVNLISTLGFPIAVSVYLLTTVDKKLDLLIKSISQLREDLAAVIKSQKEK